MNYLQKKKLAFMSVVNQVKGFVRTVMGALPLTLEGCVDEKSIIDYKIYGQSVQDGEPTPDNPIEVESVGEKTKNLINWDYLLDNTSITKTDNGYYSEGYLCSFGTSSNLVKQLKSVLKPDTTYTLSRICDKNKDGAAVGSIRIIVGGNTFVDTGIWKGLKSVTFTITQEQIDNIKYVYIYFNTGGEGATISEIQLTESDTVLPYEPYGKYKIPVTVSGRNLFNENDDFDGIFVGKDNYVHYKMQLKPNTTYITSCTENFQTAYVLISNGEEYTGKNSIWLSHKTNITLTQTKPRTFTTTDNGIIYLCCNGYAGYTSEQYKNKIKNCIENLQIEEGATATDYEPYHEPITTNIFLDEPLRKIGDYADYVDFENGKVVRNVGSYTFTGNETSAGGIPESCPCFGISTRIPTLSLSDTKVGLCNYLYQGIYSNVLSNSRFAFLVKTNHQYVYIYFAKTDFPDLTDYSSNTAKGIIKQWYDSNKPMILFYNLATPIEQPISLPTIPTHKGTSIVSADTTIQPSNAEIEYYSNVKE